MKTINSATSTLRLIAVLLFLVLITLRAAQAASATWLATPGSGDWNTAANWTAGGPPNGSADTATFAFSNLTDVVFQQSQSQVEVNGIVFNAGASAFTITTDPQDTFGSILTISGVGITNNSGITQNFVTAIANSGLGGAIDFTNSATAGSLTAFTNNLEINFSGSSTAGDATFFNGAGMQFFENSTAGNGTFIDNENGVIFFQEFSTAGNGTFNNGGFIHFFNFSPTADNSVITNNGGTVSGVGGGETEFSDTATAGNATLIANGGLNGGLGGSIYFIGTPTGGTARVEVFSNGLLDISNGSGVTTGSIEGSGLVFLGANNLTVGTNNLSTTFSGVIQDGGFVGGTDGSLTKTGKGKLTLSTANTYTGGTTVSKGSLLVTNRSGSATGTGGVAVNAGTLGGTGKISGAVTIGTARSSAILAPGSGARPGKLTLSTTLTFNARATYKVDLNSTLKTNDQVVAKGATINSGATISVDDLGSAVLTSGTIFTIISNTATTPIAGTFSNLADNSTLTVGSNTYLVSYEGGTGNDLTLTVQ